MWNQLQLCGFEICPQKPTISDGENYFWKNFFSGYMVDAKTTCSLFIAPKYVVYFIQQMHAWTWVHMIENDWKHSKMSNKVPFSKFQMSNQRLGVNQLLGVTLNRWPTNFFLCFSL